MADEADNVERLHRMTGFSAKVPFADSVYYVRVHYNPAGRIKEVHFDAQKPSPRREAVQAFSHAINAELNHGTGTSIHEIAQRHFRPDQRHALVYVSAFNETICVADEADLLLQACMLELPRADCPPTPEGPKHPFRVIPGGIG
jgi:hypothetical protein